MIYSMLEYFNKYRNTVRNINRQIEADYDKIKEVAEDMTDNAVKELVDAVMSIPELFE